MARATEASVLLALALGLGCAPTATRNLEIGVHRVRVVPPAGWETLEHGRQSYFRKGESVVSLTDLGPATTQGMARDLRAARAIWLAGRRQDAVARVRELRGPPLHFASSDQRAEYWKSWYDVASSANMADSASIAMAFDRLFQGMAKLPKIAPESAIEYVLETWPDAGRREIEHQSQRLLHGREWTELDTWDRITHMNRSRVALLDDGGYFLVLAIERGPIEITGPAFEGLLTTMKVAPETTGTR